MQNSIKSFEENPFFEKSGFKAVFFGDVMGESGLKAVKQNIPKIKKLWKPDLIGVNGENADGFGLLPSSAETMLNAGVDVITGGNHSLRPVKALDMFEKKNNVLRPHNLGNDETPGKGWAVIETDSYKVGIINLAGQVFMDPAANPFVTAENLVKKFNAFDVKIIFLDFHAEATAEKIALARFLDGKISVIWGTHTHVQTADSQILPGGTGLITDLGLTGSSSGIIGMTPKPIIRKHLTGIPSRFNPAKGNVRMQGIAILVSDSGRCSEIRRINIPV